MKWKIKKPTIHEIRVKKQFCWLPTLCENKTVWLEHIFVKEKYMEVWYIDLDGGIYPKYRWYEIDSWLKEKGPKSDFFNY